MDQNLAILIDFENIATGTEKEGFGRFDLASVFRRLKDKGRIVVARGYADWGRFAKFKQELLGLGVTMVEMTSHGVQDKNRADIALVVDAMEMAFTRSYIDTFVILSGDSDFTPVVMRLKELNKKVIGCGTRLSTSSLLVGCCDEFIFYESMLKNVPKEVRQASNEDAPYPQDLRSKPTIESAFSLLSEALDGVLQDASEPVLASLLKGAMLRKEPSFNEGDFGFSGFGRFLEAARQQGLVRLVPDARSGGYRVESPVLTNETLTEAPPARTSMDHVEGTNLPELELLATEMVNSLLNRGLHPFTRPIRRAVVARLLRIVQDRVNRQKRVTLQVLRSELLQPWDQDETIRPTMVRMLFRALRLTSLFLGNDGEPLASDTAPLLLRTSSEEEILREMDACYLHALADLGFDTQDTASVGEVLFGSPDAVEETASLMAREAYPEESPEQVFSRPEEPPAPVEA